MVPVANLRSLTSFGCKEIKRRVIEPERERERERACQNERGERRGRGLIDKTDKPV